MFEEKKVGIKNIDEVNEIVVKNLTFSTSNNEILDKVNLTIRKGEKIMLKGKSGSGKSTFLKILMGYFDVGRNMVKYDGVDLNDISNLRDKITYISQKEKLFTDSLKNNLSIYNGDFNTVIRDFYVDELVGNNSLGYNMILEEDGFNISGGQKQRVVLARACMKPFDVLLIDEGLNQVDVNLERKILKNIFNRYPNKIVIVVSHRKNNMDLFNRVFEVKNKKMIEV